MILRDLDLLAKRFLPPAGYWSVVTRSWKAEVAARLSAAPPKRILRVLRAFQTLTRSARSISVNSVLRLFLTAEDTEALLARAEIFAPHEEGDG